MRSHNIVSKAKTGRRAVSTQHSAFETKQRVAHSLHKLVDRDTYLVGVMELGRIVDSLETEGVSSFLSYIDTDSEQKAVVRKECVKIMGMLARRLGGLLVPHLSKMVASVIKRLRDTDSAVKDACVETIGLFASNIVGCGTENEVGEMFDVVAKPLFEALGEQNRYVQSGAALCFARIIDNSSKLPVQNLLPVLNRVTKFLRNPHFMAKPSLIDLARSIIQSGGATNEVALSAAMTGILDSLKNTDWTTRKAAAVALASIAGRNAPLLVSFQTVCIQALEACRFDKVKPVRDAVQRSLKCWKCLSGTNFSNICDAASNKGNPRKACDSEASGTNDGGWVGNRLRKKATPASALSGKSRSPKNNADPLTVQRSFPKRIQNHEHTEKNDWHAEILDPMTSIIPHFDGQSTQSDKSCISESIETKSVELQEDRQTPESIKECRSLNSITDTSNGVLKDCCLQTSSELALVRKQLSVMESRQSSLINLLQVFMENSRDSISALQSKVQSKVQMLEVAIDKLGENYPQVGQQPPAPSSKLLKKSLYDSSSSGIINCTEPMEDSTFREPSQPTIRNNE